MKENSLLFRSAFIFAVLLVFCLPLGASPPPAWPTDLQRGANLGGTNYTEEDIAHFALDWRANSVRILVNDLVSATWPHQVSESRKKALFDLIDLCLKYRLYTVLSFSAAFDNPDLFFSNNAFKAGYTAFWMEVAARYAESEGIAYDLMNEPHGEQAQEQWSAYAKALTDSIRTVDNVHTIVVEPPAWGWPDGFDHLVPTGDPNTVYSFHFYGPMDYTHQRWDNRMMATPESVWRQRAYPGRIEQWNDDHWDKEKMRTYIRKAVAFRDRYNVKIWCGEFGCARWAIGAEQWFKDWIDLLEEEDIGWSYYSYREWHHMDIEMDPAERVNRTSRTETDLVNLFRGYFARNTVPADFNRDGVLDLKDALSLARHQIKYPGSLAADWNADGKANVLDVLGLLLRMRRGN